MWGSTHKPVIRAIFDVNRAFLRQHYLRAPDMNSWPSSMTHYERLGTALYPYLDADKIYTPMEWPICAQDGNPNHGGEPSEYHTKS